MRVRIGVLLPAIACCLLFAAQARATDYVYGYTSLYVDSANVVRGYHRTELDYNTEFFYTPYVCASLYTDDVEVRACQGGYHSATRNTQTAYSAGSVYSALSDHYVNILYEEEDPNNPGNYYFPDVLGYSFSGEGSYPVDWYFPSSYSTTRYVESIRLGDTYVALLGRIDSVLPDRALIGNPADVIIRGIGFGNATPTVNAGTGISVIVNSANDTEIQARFNIASSAPVGNHGVSVTTSTNQLIIGGNFFVQIPGRLGRFNYPGAPAGYGPLTLTSSTNNEVRDVVGTTLLTNQCGVYRNLVYELKDQQGQPLAIPFDFTETFSNYSGVDTLPEDVPGHSSAGLVQDTQYFGKPLPNCLGSNDNESFDQRFIVTVAGIQYSLSTVVHISRGRFAGDWKVDVTTTTP